MSDETPEVPADPADNPEAVLEGDLLIDRVEQVDLQTEMQRSYLDYAMAV
ncbi:MAG: gyrA, partial [Arthrobacter sp.]|nr:gyrA [Arthrobacter sp.]